jgi:prohibitin 1
MADNQYPNLTQLAIKASSFLFIGLILAGVAGGCMTTTIRAGEGAVKFSPFGGTDLDSQFSEGLQVHAPWVGMTRYNIKIQERLEEMESLSSNGLQIGMDVTVRWRPIASELPQLHTTYGEGYYTSLIQPELRSAIRQIVGQFTPEELYSTRRTEVESGIFDEVSGAVGGRHIELDAVLVRDIRLPEQIRTAIESKLQEEQDAERYEFTIAKERLEAERKEIEANGEAEYQRIITGSLNNQFLRFKGIEATLELAKSPNAKTVIVGSGQDGLPLILGSN